MDAQGYGKFFQIGLKIRGLKKDWLFNPLTMLSLFL